MITLYPFVETRKRLIGPQNISKIDCKNLRMVALVSLGYREFAQQLGKEFPAVITTV